ncbi:MAG: hypothetical protein L6R35_003974 [Caloplaca aegaea]|nr:MAG: hypothetical protein L6R35_003974 [Caloplaca aegaea]
MDIFSEDRDASPWLWNNDREDYEMRYWDKNQGQWVTVWKSALPTAIPQDEADVAKAGVVYREMDPFEEAALRNFVSKREAEVSAHPTGTHAATTETASNDSIYKRLDRAQDMRIVQLSPGTFEESIHCTLHECSTDFEYPVDPTKQIQGTKYLTLKAPTFHVVSIASGEPIWYTAISYVWGDPAFIMPITCNGRIFKTTQNLYTALRYLRRTDVTVNLWIDQICINQNDLDEKAQQVVLMSTIYKRAWNTVIWLGEETATSSSAHATLVAIKDALQYNTTEAITTADDFERLDLPSPESEAWRALGQLLSRPWFQRLWIVQEAVLSHDLKFMDGRKHITWDDMSLFAICMMDNNLESLLDVGHSAEHEETESGLSRIRMIDRTRAYERVHPQQSSLLGPLVDGRGSRATNPRDKVYGIMGMTANPLYPDYTLPVTKVFIDAARNILDWDAPSLIDLLCCVDYEQPSENLPTWVPDWSIPRQTVSIGFYGALRGIHQSAKNTKVGWDYHPNGVSLNISGFCCDTITSIGPLAEFVLPDLIIRGSPTHAFIMECLGQVSQHGQKQPSETSIFEAFWQTLVAGKDHSGVQKAPRDYEAIFALLIDTATGRSPSFPDQPTFKRKLNLANLEVRRPGQVYRQMQIAFKAAVKGRRFGTTASGCMGLFPKSTQVGDLVCIFSGGHVPFVLRQHSELSPYQLVGECYQHGIMNGQGMSMAGFAFDTLEIR